MVCTVHETEQGEELRGVKVSNRRAKQSSSAKTGLGVKDKESWEDLESQEQPEQSQR